MITDETSLPTIFAKKIGEKFGILLKLESGINHHDYNDRIDMMRSFQQMSISTSFEEAQIAFYEYDLSQEQIQALKVIYKSTNSWIRGHAIGALMKDLAEDRIFKEKDRVAAALAILEETSEKEETDDLGHIKKNKGMLVKLTGVKNA